MLIKLLYCLEARISPNNLQISLPETLLSPTDASGKNLTGLWTLPEFLPFNQRKKSTFQLLVSITKKITS